MYDIKDIGKRIASYRKSMDMTQEELAVKLNITAQAVSKWENGLSFPDIAVLPEMTRAFNTTMDKLFGNKEIGNEVMDMNSKPKFPEYMSGTLRLVHTLDGVGCYSEKEVDITNEDSVIFKNGSNANLKSLKVVNRGPGDICFGFMDQISYTAINIHKSERHETFEGVASVKMEVNDANFAIVRSKDKRSYVDVTGSPLFISRLKITKEGELLSVGYENENKGSGTMSQENRVTIAFGRDAGENVTTRINGAGTCDINVPFDQGNISVNGSGDVTFDNIYNVECKINGSGGIKCNKAGNSKIIINGSGAFEARQISGSLKSMIHGSGDIHVNTGEIDCLEAKICGSGDIEAANICTRVANIAVEGSGNITIGRVIEESIEKHSKKSSIKVLKRG